MSVFVICYLALGVFIGLCFLDEITSDDGLDLLDEASPSSRMQAPSAISFFVVVLFVLFIFAWPLFLTEGLRKTDEDD